MNKNPDLLRATLEPVILEVIASGASYGYEITKAISKASDGQLLAQEGTLYPALHRMERRGYLKSNWAISDEGRRRKDYTLTAKGKKHLAQLRKEWESFSSTINQILGLTRLATA